MDHIRPPPAVVGHAGPRPRRRVPRRAAARPRDARASASTCASARRTRSSCAAAASTSSSAASCGCRARTNDIQPVGQFDLRRGRLLVLGQRIEFDEGSLQLVGNLDPQIHFVARTQSEDVTAIVTVDGRVSAPEITFSSEPPLPQDEVLARVLFNRATANLSAFQLAQLAAAAAELAGGGGNGLLVAAPRRHRARRPRHHHRGGRRDRACAPAGTSRTTSISTCRPTPKASARAEINLDINERVTARGSVGSDGNTTLGIFFERDY